MPSIQQLRYEALAEAVERQAERERHSLAEVKAVSWRRLSTRRTVLSPWSVLYDRDG